MGYLRLGGSQASAHVLYGDVGMSDDLPVLESLGRRIVCIIWVGEGSSFKVVDLKDDVELGVCGYILTWFRRDNDSRDHSTCCR